MEIKREEHLSPTMGDEYKKIWKKHNFKIIHASGSYDSFESYEEYLLKNKKDIEKVLLESDKSRKEYRNANNIVDSIREEILLNDPLAIKSFTFSFIDTFKVMQFAMEVHKDQKRKYTNVPYHTHLAEVAGLVSTVSSDNLSISVAWLHDCMEDCGITYETILDKFGMYVADGVKLLSDMEEGNRETRKELSRKRLSNSPKWIQDIKVCDVISNTSSIIQHDPEFAKTYLSEKRLLLNVLTKADRGLWNLASGKSMNINEYKDDNFDLSELIGKSFEVRNIDNKILVFENSDVIYTFFHKQDCCEDVRIDDFVGDIDDIQNSPIIISEEVINNIHSKGSNELEYTFYKFSTIKGSITVVWKGISNSFYSVSVNRYKHEKNI